MARKICIVFASLAAFFGAEAAEVVTYPAPATEKADTFYSVSVNGKSVDIYRALSPLFEGGEYYFCQFDFSGEIDVCVKSSKHKKFGGLKILPGSFKVKSASPRGIIFSADRPFAAIVIEKERDMPLVVFGNPIEKNPPKKGGPNVLYYGAGVHVADFVEIKSNQTLYLEGGAVLKTRGLKASGENISVCGRGIVSGELCQRARGGRLGCFDDCKNLRVEGVIFKDSANWTFVLNRCKGASVENVKICCSRMINDDAIDICNSSDISIKNVFARAQDDIVAIKCMGGKLPCENIEISDCIFWTDRANIFRIGFECFGEAMRGVKVKNIDVPFYATNYKPPENYWGKGIIVLQPTNDMPMHGFSFENISVRAGGSPATVLIATPRAVNYHGKDYGAGTLSDISIKNLSVWGDPKDFSGQLYFKGFDPAHEAKNIFLENINYFGKKIDASSPVFRVLEHASGISIK